MSIQLLNRSLLATVIGAALALGTAGTSHARDGKSAQNDARTAEEEGEDKRKARKGELKQQAIANERAEARADVRARADLKARVNADRVEARARVDANARARAERDAATRAQGQQARAELNRDRARQLAAAEARERAQAEARTDVNRARARQQALAEERAREIADARREAIRNQALPAQERARNNRDAPYGQEVSAEAHRRNAERRNDRRDDLRDDRHEAIARERARQEAYRQHLAERQRLAQQRSIDLRSANRLAQYRYQQQYYERLRQMQLRDARYDWQRDPFFNSAPSHRYWRAGNYHEVNRYAADLLRQAVRMGYEEGYQAGHADRMDGWRPDYRNSFAYQDGNYGYRGYYVDRQEYNHYFREGFRRGYEDGYYRQTQHGRYDRDQGNFSILETALALILNFRNL